MDEFKSVKLKTLKVLLLAILSINWLKSNTVVSSIAIKKSISYQSFDSIQFDSIPTIPSFSCFPLDLTRPNKILSFFSFWFFFSVCWKNRLADRKILWDPSEYTKSTENRFLWIYFHLYKIYSSISIVYKTAETKPTDHNQIENTINMEDAETSE